MSGFNGYLYIIILLKLVNILNAMPPVKSSQEDDIFFEEEMSMPDDEVFFRKNPNFPNDNKTNSNSQLIFGDPTKVIFPEEERRKVTIHYPHKNIPQPLLKISQISTCTEQDSYCENVDTYPYEHLKEVLQRNEILKYALKKKHVEKKVAERTNDKETFLCPSVVKTIIPRIGKNMKKIWQYIVNQDEVIQPVRVEICAKDKGSCDLITNLPNGYKTRCVQKYVYFQLLALGGTGDVIMESFSLPAGCACAYKRNYDFFSRLGSRFTPARRKGSNSLS